MKRFLTFLALCVALLAGAQSSAYRTALYDYFQVNGGSMLKNMEGSISQLTPYVLQSINIDASTVDADALGRRYVETQFMSDMVDIMMPYVYKEGVTIEELQSLSTICKGSGYVQAVKHMSEIDLQKVSEQIATDKLMGPLQRIAAGETPEDIVPAAPQSYVRAFHNYYEKSDIKPFMDQLIQTISGQLKQSISDQKMVDRFLDYLSRNMEPMMVDIYYGHMTEQDMAASAAVCDHPAYAKIQASALAAVSDAQSMGLALISKYGDWLKKNAKK